MRGELAALVPAADVEEMGGTSVPGALTKGDLDVLVRVPAQEHSAAVAALGERYRIHQPENWSEVFASFDAGTREGIPVGLQLVAAGSHDDLAFTRFPELLRSDPELLRRYNELKLAHTGADPESYVRAKWSFIERALDESSPSS